MPECPMDTRAVLFALRQVLLLRSDICSASDIAFGSLLVDKIPLTPKVLITILIHQKYHSMQSITIKSIKANDCC